MTRKTNSVIKTAVLVVIVFPLILLAIHCGSKKSTEKPKEVLKMLSCVNYTKKQITLVKLSLSPHIFLN